MQELIFCLKIYFIGFIGFFLFFIWNNFEVRFSNKAAHSSYYLTGIKKILIYLLFALLWPYMILKNMFKED